ncbi:MAG: hypothetical protein KBT36_12935 [Kurthia sp.]|nr:hypothetical protein [Candidatus Kurthia equi]
MKEPKELSQIVPTEAIINVLDNGKVVFHLSSEKQYDYEFEKQEIAELFAKGLQRVVELFMEVQIPLKTTYLN